MIVDDNSCYVVTSRTLPMSSKRKDVYWRVDGSPSGSLGPLTNGKAVF